MAAMLTPFAGWTCSLNSNKQCKPCQVLSRHAPVSDCSSLTCIQVVLGRDYPQETVDYLGSLYRTWAKGLLDWPYLDLPFTGYGRAKKAQRDLYKFFQGCVSEAREQLAHGKSVPGILGSLVAAIDEDGNRLTDSELGDNLLLVLLAGHDTSSSTLTNTMAHLQSNPHVMVQLRAEQQRRCVWPVLSPA
eukprot:GHRR01011138.1.p1 GENE.GHRR01011138.1~~GHRR01011138.1.p1  ORF type:complete len:189 (+),score=52.30 GHRR01011138.1:1164-1730(+)